MQCQVPSWLLQNLRYCSWIFAVINIPVPCFFLQLFSFDYHVCFAAFKESVLCWYHYQGCLFPKYVEKCIVGEFTKLKSEMIFFGNLTAMQPHFDYNYFEMLIIKDIKLAKGVFLLKKITWQVNKSESDFLLTIVYFWKGLAPSKCVNMSLYLVYSVSVMNFLHLYQKMFQKSWRSLK